MPGPAPKAAGQRRRRNVVAGARTLHVVDDPVVPDLPEVDGGWHSATLAWWADIWMSPMSPEWDESDVHGLFVLARLVDLFWTGGGGMTTKEIAAEIRLQRQCFGLSPIDRRRLQWEIDRGDEAAGRTVARRGSSSTAVSGRKDPRLKAV